MSNCVRIELLPLGRTLTAERGTALRDILFPQGVEFPCGGHGKCKGCRIRMLAAIAPATADEERVLTREDLEAGWRLACCHEAAADMQIELAQWETAVLSDNSAFEFTPAEGFGVAVDLGTTTIVAQLLDLSNGNVLAVRTALNVQGRHGADVMSRLEFAVHERGQAVLQNLIRNQIGQLIRQMLDGFDAANLKSVVIVGNTAMHHLFCGLDVQPLAFHPFEPKDKGLQIVSVAELGWRVPSDVTVQFLPCLGGFVGSDILAGIFATRLHETEEFMALLDLGTNGEIVVGNRDRLLCASTAAGPAFEGARITMGMRATTGAISEAIATDGHLRCRVLGNAVPRGICGSGLVDAVAAGLDLNWIQPNGRLSNGKSLMLALPVVLTQSDIRELQLAKGAIAAGLKILVDTWGGCIEDLKHIHLAGAFGNYIRHASARRIGLLNFPPERVHPAGNTALLGAKLALFGDADQMPAEIAPKIEHVPLNEHPRFEETFIGEMGFPR